MAKICDNKSVGVIIEDERGRLAVIFRRNYPRAFAPIAGHLDGIASRNAAKKETEEEGGLILGRFVPILEERIENPCRRGGGTYHDWTIFVAYEWIGELRASSDAKEARWIEPKEFTALTERTEYFMKKYSISHEDVDGLTRAIFGDPANPRTDPEWEKNPGLEPVWYYIFKKCGKI